MTWRAWSPNTTTRWYLATAEGWTRDGDAPRWRDDGDPARVLAAIEIEEGVLVATWDAPGR